MLYKTLAFIAIFNSGIGAIVIAQTINEAHNAYKQELIHNLPVSVSIPSAEIEVDFVPTHSLYQKRCLVNGELVYCANTDALATVAIVDSEIEIDFVPSDEEARNVVCGEYTCTFTPSSIDFVADAE